MNLSDNPAPGDFFRVTGIAAVGHRMRRKGLAGLEIEDAPHEMYFEKCRSIHTFGMKFDLRVIFLDGDFRVIDSRIVAPKRVVFAPHKTYAIVEQPLR